MTQAKAQKKVDVALLIAFDEEFESIRRLLPAKVRVIRDEQYGGSYLLFSLPTRGSRPLKLLCRVIGRKGPEDARAAAERMLSEWEPRVAVILGLAGSLDNDVVLGDIVVADQVDAYGANLKAVPDRLGSFRLLHRGQVEPVSHSLLEAVKDFALLRGAPYERWEKRCETALKEFVAAPLMKSALKSHLLHSTPRIHRGPLASGPILGASTGFKRWLSLRNSTYLALEQESTGLAAAAFKRRQPVPAVVLRCISDFADHRKRRLDRSGSGAFRRYALHNAITLLLTMLSSGSLVDASPKTRSRAASRTKAIRSYLRRLASCCTACVGTCWGQACWCRQVLDASLGQRTYVVPRLRVTAASGALDTRSLPRVFADWLAATPTGHLAILGDYGIGKTSACVYLAHQLADARLKDPERGPLPLLLPLEHMPASPPEDLISLLFESFKLPLARDVLRAAIRRREVVFFLDGFDEMAATASAARTLRRFRDLTPFFASGCRTVFTCRTHFFANDAQVASLLQGRVTGTDLATLYQRHTATFQLAELQEFSTPEILEAIRLQRPNSSPARLWRRIQSVYDLSDLSRRPMMLHLVLSTLDEIKKHVQQGERVNASRLYALYVDFCLRREADKKRPFDMEARRDFAGHVAAEMWRRTKYSIGYRTLGAQARKAHDASGIANEAESREYGARTTSFLVRDGEGNYRFLHRSFMEYFVADRCLGEALRGKSGMRTWKARWFNREIGGFVAGALEYLPGRVDTLLRIGAGRADRILMWNVLHALSLLPSDTMSTDERISLLRGVMARAEGERNAVMLRQYARLGAKFIGLHAGRALIAKTIARVVEDAAQDEENTRTYVEYYHGRRSAIEALLEHLRAHPLKYDYRLHLHVLGRLGNARDADALESRMRGWSQSERRRARGPLMQMRGRR